MSAKFILASWLSDVKRPFRDDERAFLLYSDVAKNGNSLAMYNLAVLYFEGRGTPQNLSLALEWFERAGEAGLIAALVNLGNMHRDGIGTERNLEKACAIYKRGADVQNETCKALLEQALQSLKQEKDKTNVL